MLKVTPEVLEAVAGLPVRLDDQTEVFAGLPTLKAQRVSEEDHIKILREIEEVIATRRFRVIGEDNDQKVWQTGWSEVSTSLNDAGCVDLEQLKPQYFHQGVPMRLVGDYWVPRTDYFEYWLGVAVRRLFMLHAFEDPKRIVELGCGTGINLIIAAELFKNAHLIGGDWAPASKQILDKIAKTLNRNISGAVYDMFSSAGIDELQIDENTCVLTVHALEQLGGALQKVLELLLESRPQRILHIEPILDFYDQNNPYDNIAARYHVERGYLQGLVGALEQLEAEKRIQILHKGRVRMGNLYHEAYSCIIWKPL